MFIYTFVIAKIDNRSKMCSLDNSCKNTRGGSRAAAASKMECFVIIVNGWKPLTIITKHSILFVAAALDPPLETCSETFFRIVFLDNIKIESNCKH